MFCTHCGLQMTDGSQYCSKCGAPMVGTGNPFKDGMRHVVRPRVGRKIAGVCLGFAQAYGWDLSVVRIVMLLTLCFGGGGLLVYVIAWIVLPNGPEPVYAAPVVTPPPGPTTA